MRIMIKTGSYGIMHVTLAIILAYLLTRDWKIALSIGILEPVVQTLAFPLHDWLWERKKLRFNMACHHGDDRAEDNSSETSSA